MAVLSYSQSAATSGFQTWLMQQGLTYCQQRQAATQTQVLPTAPGSGIYVRGGDTLRYSVWSSGGAHTVHFGGQFQTLQGEWQLFGERIVTGSGSNFATVTRPATAGWYTNAVGSIDPGETVFPPGVWARVELGRQNIGQFLPYALLFQGYISTQAVAAMNAGSNSTSGGSSGAGGGCCPTNMWADTVGGTTSLTYAAGVTTGVNTRLIFAATSLTTSGTAGNRVVTLSLLPSSGFGWETKAIAVQAASTTRGYVWQAGGERRTNPGDGDEYLDLPDDIWFDFDFTVLINIEGVKSGDDFATADLTFQDK